MTWGFRKLSRRAANKYGARKTIVEGKSFPSALEGSVYALLRNLERAKEITALQLQDCVRFPGTKIKSKIDFSYTDVKTGERIWVEAKGVEGARWVVIRQLWVTHGPGKLQIYKGTWRRPLLTETIQPKNEKGEMNENKNQEND